MKLYEISELYNDFMYALENGEIDPEMIPDTLEAIEATFNDKVDNIACMIKSYEAEAAAIKAEAATLTERAKAKQNNADRLKEYIKAHMLRTGMRSVESTRAKVSFRRSESVEIADEGEFIRYMHEAGRDDLLTFKAPTPNKTAIKAAIKNGHVLPFAEIVEKQNLQIK